MPLKTHLKNALLRFGYEVRRIDPSAIGCNPYLDMSRFAESGRPAILFDVGANRGQTITAFRSHFASPVIHSFEPSPSTFQLLRTQSAGIPNLHLNNVAVGSQCESRTLIEGAQDTLSSLLPPGKDYEWGKVRGNVEVDVIALDDYCGSNGIASIDVLKSDTQGFDLEVLKGATNLLREHKIHLVFIELNFADLYRDMGKFDEVYAFLSGFGFQPVSFYNISSQKSRLAWMDGLFIDPQWNQV